MPKKVNANQVPNGRLLRRQRNRKERLENQQKEMSKNSGKNMQVNQKKKNEGGKRKRNRKVVGVGGVVIDKNSTSVRSKQFRVDNPEQQVIIKNPADPDLQTLLNIVVMPDTDAFSFWILGTASYLLQKGIFTKIASNQTLPTPANTLAAGLGFILQGLGVIASGGQSPFKKVPAYINYLAEAIKPKVVPFQTASISYSYGLGDYFAGFNGVMQINGNNWVFGDVLDTGNYDNLIEPISLPAFDEQLWNELISTITNEALPLTALKTENTFEASSKDSSAFARNYSYNGIGDSAAGSWYGDCENEANFKQPMLAKFAIYNETQLRVSRSFYPSAGDSNFTMTLPLSNLFEYRDYKSKFPPMFKMIDFDEIFAYVCSWMVTLFAQFAKFDQYPEGTPGSSDYRTSLPFTQQDFRIVLRQALMVLFSESQNAAQFMQPAIFATPNNGFQPFYAHCGTYGLPVFGTILLPQLIVDNLRCLKMRKFYPQGVTNKSNSVYYVPVLGRFIMDSVNGYTIPTSNNGNPPLFTIPTGPDVQTVISLQDGAGPIGSYNNLNGSYYQTVLTAWNDIVNQFAEWSTPILPLVGDQGPLGFNLLATTRYVTTITADISHLDKIRIGHMRNCVEFNHELRRAREKRRSMSPPPKDKDKVKEKEISESRIAKMQRRYGALKHKILLEKALPPSELLSLVTTNITMNQSMSAEFTSLLDMLVLPVARVDPSSVIDPTSQTMFQVESLEPKYLNKSTIGVDGTIGGVTRWEQLYVAGASLAPGTAAANNTVLSRVTSMLTDSSGGGFLADLAAGVVGGIFPSIAPIASQIAKVVPF
jgi:hypothetical protein